MKIYSRGIPIAVFFTTILVIGCSNKSVEEVKDKEEVKRSKVPSCYKLYNDGNMKTEEELTIMRRNRRTPPDKYILDNRLPDDKLRKKGLEAAKKLCYPADEVKEWKISQAGKYCKIVFYTEKPDHETLGGQGFYVLLDCVSGDLVHIFVLQ
jgi:hypothetical protein